MKKLEFNIVVSSNLQNVWFALWDDYHYRQWTSVFSKGSYAVSNWEKGSKIHFLSPDGNGMYSQIEEITKERKMVFRHLGIIKHFEEQPHHEETQIWAGAREIYLLSENNHKVLLSVSLDISEKYYDYFLDTFPKGLAIIKKLAENLEIFVETKIAENLDTVWQKWTNPEDIICWNAASDDWHTTSAKNDLWPGGSFSYRMEARDGSNGFDFTGTYTKIEEYKIIEYSMPDERKVRVDFSEENGICHITELFDAESIHSPDLQKQGWQAILENFKKYVEKNETA